MKQFLRYQISGMVFFVWAFIFYYSGKATDAHHFLSFFMSDTSFEKIIGGIASALPIGVFIHQISVSIKNYIIGGLCAELEDSPKRELIEKLKNDKHTEYVKYILERISNLNSFYYVRFDNGFLAPFLALIMVISFGYSVNFLAVIFFVTVSVILLSYLPRICRELQEYKDMLQNPKN